MLREMVVAARFAAALMLLTAAVGSASAQSVGESDAYAWLQYAADGRPHVRVIPSDRAACPSATADDRGVALLLRVPAGAGFDRVLCDGALPADAHIVKIGALTLPPVPVRIARFVVLGDTGCRVKVTSAATDIQNCHDAKAWPFARIAASIAVENPRPDLIVHVGGYAYRESPCPAGDARCDGSPYGDNWTSWAVDFFEPGGPLFETAPLVFVRGSHEDCARAGVGWTRYLAPDPAETCRRHDDAVSAAFGDLRFVNVDSASGNDNDPTGGFEADERIAAAARGRETILLTHRAPLAGLAAQGVNDPSGAGIAAVLSGHPRLFAALSFSGAPPLIVVGTGGDSLSTDAVPGLERGSGATVDARFGYAVFDRIPGGWSISERDPDGTEHRRCELHARTVHCG
jgi:hypothetical protein